MDSRTSEDGCLLSGVIQILTGVGDSYKLHATAIEVITGEGPPVPAGNDRNLLWLLGHLDDGAPFKTTKIPGHGDKLFVLFFTPFCE